MIANKNKLMKNENDESSLFLKKNFYYIETYFLLRYAYFI